MIYWKQNVLSVSSAINFRIQRFLSNLNSINNDDKEMLSKTDQSERELITCSLSLSISRHNISLPLFTVTNNGVLSNSHFDEFIFPIVAYHRDDRDIRDAREG